MDRPLGEGENLSPGDSQHNSRCGVRMQHACTAWYREESHRLQGVPGGNFTGKATRPGVLELCRQERGSADD